MNKDHAYHQIALACLKALRESGNATASNPAQLLYSAIDQAFNEQYSLLLTELDHCYDRLKRIAELDPKQHTLADAQQLAQQPSDRH